MVVIIWLIENRSEYFPDLYYRRVSIDSLDKERLDSVKRVDVNNAVENGTSTQEVGSIAITVSIICSLKRTDNKVTKRRTLLLGRELCTNFGMNISYLIGQRSR